MAAGRPHGRRARARPGGHRARYARKPVAETQLARVAPAWSRSRQRDVLLDTGPLVAVLDARDQWHAECAAAWPAMIERCVTVEAVITEACHLVLRGGGPAHLPLDFLLSAEIPILGLETGGHRRAMSLMHQYAKLPMGYADASLVALAEGLDISTAFTTDRRGFSAYRPPRGRRFAMIPETRKG